MLYKRYKMTSDYGSRILDNGDSRNHNGIDLVGIDKNIICPVDGEVVSSTIISDRNNLTWEWGNYVRIDSKDGYRHFFCHLSERKVKVGDQVKQGDIIGIEGNTGYSFGSHCHYGIRNPRAEWVNPQTYHHSNLEEGKMYGKKDYKYTETKNGTRQVFIPLNDFKIAVYPNLINNRKLPYDTCINGTFFGGNPVYSTSILMADNNIYRWGSNYCDKGLPQDTFVIYRDGTVRMRRIKNIAELDTSKIRYAIGGVGLVDNTNPNFKYNPTACGFDSSVTRKANKTVLGYIRSTNELIFMTRPNIFHSNVWMYDLLQLVKDCEYDIAIALDGSGSSSMKVNGEYKLLGDGRGIYSVLYAEES